jgi:Protein of unknown function (DUF1573)
MACRCWHFFASMIILALLAEAGCQGRAKEPAVSTAAPAAKEKEVHAASAAGRAAPKITFEKSLYDFGQVSPGSSQMGQFTFTNTGHGLLKIIEVKKCCGAVIKLDKKQLAPGESSVLKVQYYFNGSGTMTRQIHLTTNDPVNPHVTLTLKARVVPRVVCDPKRLELFVRGPKAGCPPITITSIDNKPFSITSFKSTRDCMTAEFDPSVKATKFVLHPTVHFTRLQGASVGLVTIGLAYPERGSVSIYFRPVPDFKITPQALILINSEPQKPIARKVLVQSNYNEAFQIASVSSKKGFVKLRDEHNMGNGYHLDLEITPPAADATRKFDDLLYLHLNGDVKLQVKLYGWFKKQ